MRISSLRPSPQPVWHTLELPGATGILTLRCHQASDRRHYVWSQPHNQIATA
jgi:hypothetical protein